MICRMQHRFRQRLAGLGMGWQGWTGRIPNDLFSFPAARDHGDDIGNWEDSVGFTWIVVADRLCSSGATTPFPGFLN